MKKLILALLLVSSSVAGEEVNVDVIAGGWSKHASSTKDYNENHKAVGVKLNNYLLMTYENSIRKQSWVVGKYYYHHSFFNGKVKAGGIVAAVSGYNSTGAVPAYLPTVSIDYGYVGTDIVSIPGVVTYAHFRIKDVGSFTNPVNLADVSDRALAFGYSYGSLGSSYNLHRRFSSSYSGRVFVTTGFFGRSENLYGGMYNEWLDTDTFGATITWHPFKGKFGLEAGVIHNGLDYNADARRWVGVSTLGSPISQASLSFSKPSAYAGISYNNIWGRSLGYTVRLGAMSLSGHELTTSGIDEEDISFPIDIEWYPVFEIGLTHTF